MPVLTPHLLPLVSGVDFAASGLQLGHLAVDHSNNAHDAAVIPSPIAVINGAPGPTAMLIAGTHGDEYEGQVLLQEMIRTISPDDVTGRLIILPALNILAVREGRRVSEVDGTNMNRALPGQRCGGPADQIAAIVAEDLMPLADYVIDIHSGGTNSEYVPSAFVYSGPDPQSWKRKVAAVEAFNMPYAVVVKPMLKPGSISGMADKLGITMISTELSGRGGITIETLDRARHGLRSLLAHWGLLPAPAAGMAAETPAWIELVGRSAVHSTTAGLFEPKVVPGQHVRAGELLARVYSIEELDRPAKDFFAPMDGIVAIVRQPPLVSVGTTLVDIAVDHGTSYPKGNNVQE
jgi:predicted deacylase